VAIADNDNPPTVQFDSTAYAAIERRRSGHYQAFPQHASSLTVTVNYATSDGTARSGSDYAALNDLLSLAQARPARLPGGAEWTMASPSRLRRLR